MLHPLIALGLWRRLADVPLVYVLLWCSLTALSVVLVALSRTRWAQRRPLHKCAVLSLLVHVVFACLAMTVRVVVGDGEEHGYGPPIRVRIIEESPAYMAMDLVMPNTADTIPDLLPPALHSAAEPEHESAGTATSEPSRAKPSDSEADPTETVTSDGPRADDATPEEAAVVDVLPVGTADEIPGVAEAPPAPANPSAAATAAGDVATAIAEPSRAAVPAAVPASPSPYALRTAPGRLGWVESQGGNVRTEAAVTAALAWLAAAQSPDGRWDADQFGAGRELVVMGQNRSGAGANADTGVSALALLAFLGAGHSHQQGDYQATVQRGLDFLIRSQGTDGNLFGQAELYAQMYCHSMAAFALAEAVAMTRDSRLQPAVAQAIDFSLRAQHVSTGGWRYRPGDTGDTSQLGWQMMALTSAQRAGVTIPASAWSGVERFLRSVRRGNHGGLASYRPDGPASKSMTAEAFYCRLLLKETVGGAADDLADHEAATQLLTALPDADRVNLYYWYYATLALHHRQLANGQAAAAWHAWNDALTAVLLSKQVASGSDAGSWNADCLWGGYGGRVYTTAVAAMCLEVYYRYAPAPTHHPWMATHPPVPGASR